MKIERSLRAILSTRLRFEEPMSKHTTIGVGGCARYFAVPASAREIISLIRLARKNNLQYMVIGRGSNLLVRDGGYDGLVIKLAGNFSKVKVNEESIYTEAGASLSLLARKTVKLSRTGLEFALGIPGSVGGAVWMNAGAYGKDIGTVLLRLKCVDVNGEVITLHKKQARFDYRDSRLPSGSTILSVTLRCPRGVVDKGILKLATARKDTQPLGEKSFGCAFVNPPGHHAGRLIDKCGLKGKRIGGAVISEKHANFILNVGPGTKASDIENLVNLARMEVKRKFGITLKQEVVIIGHK